MGPTTRDRGNYCQAKALNRHDRIKRLTDHTLTPKPVVPNYETRDTLTTTDTESCSFRKLM